MQTIHCRWWFLFLTKFNQFNFKYDSEFVILEAFIPLTRALTKSKFDGMKTFLLLESQIVSLVKSIGLSRKFLWGTIIIRYDFYEVSEWRMGLNSGCLKVRRSEWCFLGPDPWIRVAGSPWFPRDPRWPTDAWHCLALQWPPAKPVGTLLHQEDAVQRGLGHAVAAHLGPSVWVS